MKGNENSTLTPRQLQALPYLLSCPSYEEAARSSGISAKQIHSWLKQPEFQEELKRQRNAIFCEALATLKASTQKAVQTLISLLDNDDPRIQLIASEKILANAFKGAEIQEFEERITYIENLVKNTEKKSNPSYMG